jgi:HEAT repeat protein
VDLAQQMVSEKSDEAEQAWQFVWRKRGVKPWISILPLLPCFLITEHPAAGLPLARRWLVALATNFTSSDKDLGDQGLTLALVSSARLSDVQNWQGVESLEVERVLVHAWIERISKASSHQQMFRLKRLYGLARAIGMLHPSTVIFAAESLATHYSENRYHGLDTYHDLESALEYLLDSASNETLLTLLAQGNADISHSLEQAFFLRGTQAPLETLVTVACDTSQPKASRVCAIHSLSLLGLSGILFPVEPLIGALNTSDDSALCPHILWALSTQGTRVPEDVFRQYEDTTDNFIHRCVMAGLTAPERPDSRLMLLKALRDKNKFVRVDAIWTLCRIGEPLSSDILVTVLHDREVLVRQEATRALHLLGKHIPVKILVAVLESEDTSVHQAAAEVLAGLGNHVPVEPMRKHLRQAAKSFPSFHPHDIRVIAARALGRAGDPASREILNEALNDVDPQVVLAALEALHHLGVQPSPYPLLTHPGLTIPRTRSLIACALSRPGEQSMRSALLTFPQQPPVWEQEAAVEVLGECEIADAAEALRFALREKHILVQIAAMAAMSKHPDLHAEILLDRFFRYLQSPNERLRASAGRALWQIGQHVDLPVEALIDLLDQPSGFPLAHILGARCQKIPAERVSALLQSDQPHMRIRAIEILGAFGENAPVELLIPMLQDTDGYVRYVTVEVLGTLSKRIPIEALTKMLQDEDDEVRKAAIEALVKAGPRAPLEALIQALDDEECEVDIAATSALFELKVYQPLRHLLDIALYAQEPERQVDAMIKLIEAGVIEHFAADIPIEACLHALTSEQKGVRQYAAEILAILARHGKAIPADPLLALVEDQDDMVCGAVLNALSELTPGVPSEIFLRFQESKRNYPRMCAIGALGKRGEEAPVERILECLALPGHAYQGVRSAAVEALANLGDYAPREALVQALHDEQAHIRWQAAEALKQLGPRLPIDLLESLLYTSDTIVRRLALDILKACRPDAFSRFAQTAREKLMRDTENGPNLQNMVLFAEAASYLKHPSPELIEMLVQWLDHANHGVQRQAALALGQLQRPLSEAAWQRLFALQTESETLAVRSAATHALHELLSLEIGPSEALFSERDIILTQAQVHCEHRFCFRASPSASGDGRFLLFGLVGEDHNP